MTSFAFASLHGAPGVTTTVVGLAAAWPRARRPLVVEADPDGGVLAARFDGLRADRTLAEVAVEVRRRYAHDAVVASARALWGAVPVVVAPPSAEQTCGALATAGERLGPGLAGAGDPVLIDVGRLTLRSPALALARAAAVVVVVTRPGFEEAAALAPRCAELQGAGCALAVVVVGAHPYRPDEVAAAAGVELVGVLPDDARSAATLAGGAGGDRRLRRSLLWRALADLAARLGVVADAPEMAAPTGPVPPAGARLAPSNGSGRRRRPDDSAVAAP